MSMTPRGFTVLQYSITGIGDALMPVYILRGHIAGIVLCGIDVRPLMSTDLHRAILTGGHSRDSYN